MFFIYCLQCPYLQKIRIEQLYVKVKRKALRRKSFFPYKGGIVFAVRKVRLFFLFVFNRREHNKIKNTLYAITNGLS